MMRRLMVMAGIIAVVLLLTVPVLAQAGLAVSVGDVQGAPNTDVEIPIDLKGAAGVGAMRIEVTYDPAVISVRDVKGGDLASGALVVGNTATPGLVTISVAHATGFSGDGKVALLVARPAGQDGDRSPLTLQNVTANHFQTKALIPTTLSNGEFTVGRGTGGAGGGGVWIIVGLMGLIVVGALLYAFTRRTTTAQKQGPAPAPAAGKLWGIFVTAGTATPTFLALDQPVTTIGRSADNRLVIDDERVSRQHARVVTTGHLHTLYDLGGANGVIVNGQRVTQHVLQLGDQVLLGSTTLVVRQL